MLKIHAGVVLAVVSENIIILLLNPFWDVQCQSGVNYIYEG